MEKNDASKFFSLFHKNCLYLLNINLYTQRKNFSSLGYRRALISNRINLGCPAHISEILTNHTPNTIQFKHYYSRILEQEREDYDTWFPYKDLPYF